MTNESDILDLLWSFWTELGIPGVIHDHRRIAIDPEPLLLFTPYLASGDARLMEMVWTWCARHHGQIGTARLRRLHGQAPVAVREAFDRFSAVLQTGVRVRWPASSEPPGMELEPATLRPLELPLSRPSLVWLRARAILGAGSRADLLCAFLASSRPELRAVELEPVGYSRRVIDDVLGTWVDAGMLSATRLSGVSHYALVRPQSWLDALGALQVRWVDLQALLELLTARVDLGARADAPDIVRRIEAAKARDAVQDLAARKRLALPAVDGNPQAFDQMLAFLDRAWRDEDPARRPTTRTDDAPAGSPR